MSLEVTSDELYDNIKKDIPMLILDTRAQNSYMMGHIEGAANAKCSNMQQKQTIMSKLPRNYKIVLVDENGEEAAQNASMLARFGFDAHYLKGGIKSWDKKLVKTEQEPYISNEELWDSLKKKEKENNDDVYLLDVREPDEYNSFKIPGAVNIPLSRLFTPDTVTKLPRDKKIVTVCSHGNRSMVATFALAQQGIHARSLEGGMAGWNQVLNPTVAVHEEERGKEGDKFTIIQVEKVGKGCLSHIIGSQGEAVIIDPNYPPSKYVEFAQKQGLEIKKVIDTHQHADHVSAARELAKQTGAELYLSVKEEYSFKHYNKVDDGDQIDVGKKQIRVIHTPGHTLGSMTFVIEDKYAFCGDTLFVESIGRPDLRDKAEEFAHYLYDTLHNKLLSLPPDTKIFPTHHGEAVKPVENGIFYTTPTKAKELSLLDLGEEAFVKEVVNVTTPRPMNYSVIIKVNKGITPVNNDQIPDLEMGPNRCSI